MTVILPASLPVRTPPTTRRSACRRFVRSLLAPVLAVLVTVVVVVAGTHGAAALPAQDPAPTEEPAVPGVDDPTVTNDDETTGDDEADAGDAGDGLDPGAVTAVEPVADGSDRSAVDAENRRIWLVVGGLVAVALALAALTIRYWFHTRPVLVAEPLANASSGGRRERGGRRSRRAVAGADHAAADESWEPRGTGEFERVVVAPVARQTRPTADQRRAAYEAARRT